MDGFLFVGGGGWSEGFVAVFGYEGGFLGRSVGVLRFSVRLCHRINFAFVSPLFLT